MKLFKSVQEIEGASLKVQIFLWYACELKDKKCTREFPYFKKDLTPFIEMGKQKLRDEYFQKDRPSYTLEKYEKDFEWAAMADAKILYDKKDEEMRDELVKEGFLWLKKYEKTWGHNGKIIYTYVGLTDKGRKWAPKYIAKYGESKVANVPYSELY